MVVLFLRDECVQPLGESKLDCHQRRIRSIAHQGTAAALAWHECAIFGQQQGATDQQSGAAVTFYSSFRDQVLVAVVLCAGNGASIYLLSSIFVYKLCQTRYRVKCRCIETD
jgi:hypothetical protein